VADVPERIPRKLGRYEVRGKIGEGGMATVYLAADPRRAGALDGSDLLALKVIKDAYAMNNEFVTMFTDEAQLASQFSHPSIVRVFELGADGPRLFIAMEFLRGQSLWSVWNACRERGVRLRYDVAAHIGARVAEGLHYAHEARGPRGDRLELVHRDVNASNVFVTYSGEVKVIDFGLAKAANKLSRTRAGMVKGKLAYMSPEQAVGREVDRRTDIFALGISLWECTVDRRLFKGTSESDTLERVHAAFVPDPRELVEGYPDALWNVLRKSLERDPDARYATAAEMAKDLYAAASLGGRVVDQHVVSGIMHALFGDEIEKQRAWTMAANQAPRAAEGPRTSMAPAAVPTLNPGPSTGELMVETPDIAAPTRAMSVVDVTWLEAQSSERASAFALPAEVLSSRDFNTAAEQQPAGGKFSTLVMGKQPSIPEIVMPFDPSRSTNAGPNPGSGSAPSYAPPTGRGVAPPSFAPAPLGAVHLDPRLSLAPGALGSVPPGALPNAMQSAYASVPPPRKTPWPAIIILAVLAMLGVALVLLALKKS
jgi:eukaryotic-like serine/threonine-protein kinase